MFALVVRLIFAIYSVSSCARTTHPVLDEKVSQTVGTQEDVEGAYRDYEQSARSNMPCPMGGLDGVDLAI